MIFKCIKVSLIQYNNKNNNQVEYPFSNQYSETELQLRMNKKVFDLEIL